LTILAWDGKIFCADRMASSSGMPFCVTKIFKIDVGIIGIDGVMDIGLSLIEWIKAGANPKEYPECQKNNDRYAHALLITPKLEILRYERQPYPIKVEEPYFAAGSGRDYAMAAMAMGKSAREAVELACRFDIDCGNGIDEFGFDVIPDTYCAGHL
jgi:hypothetical protein